MLSNESGPELVNFSGEEEVFYGDDFKRPSKAAERSGWKNEVQAELDELGDLYDLPESLRDVDLPGVRL